MRVLVGCECSSTVTSAFRVLVMKLFLVTWLLVMVICRSFILLVIFDSTGSIKDLIRYEQGLLARDFFLWCLSLPVSMLCVENPVSLRLFQLPIPSQIVQPWFFGDPYMKATCLWLRGLPPLQMTCPVSPVGSWTALHKSARIRSKTFSGLAAAMVRFWGSGDLVDCQLPLFSSSAL